MSPRLRLFLVLGACALVICFVVWSQFLPHRLDRNFDTRTVKIRFENSRDDQWAVITWQCSDKDYVAYNFATMSIDQDQHTILIDRSYIAGFGGLIGYGESCQAATIRLSRLVGQAYDVYMYADGKLVRVGRIPSRAEMSSALN